MYTHTVIYTNLESPFSQRIWIALEAKGIPYQYCEADPFSHSAQPILANPRGCVPTIEHGDWSCSGSAVILEYVSLVSRLLTCDINEICSLKILVKERPCFR
jgi:glutathione S-transferase